MIIIKRSHYKSSKRLFFSLLIINKYYTKNSMRPLFRLFTINAFDTKNCIKPFVAIQFIILNFCRQLRFSFCITNYYLNIVIKHILLEGLIA